jgi:cold shock protein
VLDSSETPGGCWAHFSVVATVDYRRLAVDQPVEFEWERADQDGFGYRALRVWPAGLEPADRPPSDAQPSAAYRSTLTITLDTAD